MKILNTRGLDDKLLRSFSDDLASWTYNGLDCALTHEITTALQSELESAHPDHKATYEFAMRKQPVFIEMMLRGIRVDNVKRHQVINRLTDRINKLDKNFQRLCVGVFDTEINWNSPVQVTTLFYSLLGLKPIRKRNSKGMMAPTTNEAALVKFRLHPYACIFANHILALREAHKLRTFFRTAMDEDGRIRTTFNVAGTDTGRLSSSASGFGTGMNIQNVPDDARVMFIPDEGMAFVNIDLEQADARNVGAILATIFHETHPDAAKYLDFCESGDLHTNVCRIVWPEFDWSDDPKHNRAIADQTFYRTYSYRDATKRVGHGTNYMGLPPTISANTQIPQALVKEFQQKYFAEFPLIPQWHKWTHKQLVTTQRITTLFGRPRTFWNRAQDDETLRAAVAHQAQSMTGEEIDRGIVNVWERKLPVQFLAQVHDSILLQTPVRLLPRVVPVLLRRLETHLTLPGGRDFFVPLEAQTGFNWSYYDPNTNPLGLRKWRGEESRQPPVSDGWRNVLGG